MHWKNELLGRLNDETGHAYGGAGVGGVVGIILIVLLLVWLL